MSKRWIVSAAADAATVANQVGCSEREAREMMAFFGSSSDVIGEVEAPTKGAAIMAAHLKWPRVRVEHLDVRLAPEAA